MGRVVENVLYIWYSVSDMISSENKAKVISDFKTNDKDVGSPQVQVAVLTNRIKEITAHLKENKHDQMARRGLLQMVGRRKRLLKYLEAKSYEEYQSLIAKLGLRK